jgi:hypothetical protein
MVDQYQWSRFYSLQIHVVPDFQSWKTTLGSEIEVNVAVAEKQKRRWKDNGIPVESILVFLHE